MEGFDTLEAVLCYSMVAVKGTVPRDLYHPFYHKTNPPEPWIDYSIVHTVSSDMCTVFPLGVLYPERGFFDCHVIIACSLQSIRPGLVQGCKALMVWDRPAL